MSRLKATFRRWLAPAIALTLAAAVVTTAYLQQRASLDDIEHNFRRHAASVTGLVQESAHQATAAIDQLYQMAADELSAVGLDLADRSDDALKHALAVDAVAVWVVDDGSAVPAGEWSTVPAGDRAALIAQLRTAEIGSIVDDGPAADLDLYCARLAIAGGSAVLCREAAALSETRRQLGLGRLLANAETNGVVYAVIQDEQGIIAASPHATSLTRLAADPFLTRARDAADRRMRFRRQHSAGTPVVEGAAPFALPDGTLAVLRVAVDATSLVTMRQRLNLHLLALIAVAALLVALTIAVSVVLERSERRREEHAADLARRDEEQRHWQAIGQLAATVAHEVRSPLNTLQMLAQRLGREFSVAEDERTEYQELVGLLRSESDRVNRVVTDFLDLGRPLVLERRRVAAAELLRDAVAPLRVRAEVEHKRIAVEDRAGSMLDVDPRRFGQLLNNLIGNALDAVPEQGLVTVACERNTAGHCITVSDNGPGMTAEQAAQAQQPFVTTKAHGTGLGLPLARRLAEAHGGSLQLQSNPGQGTVARVALPDVGEQDER